MQQITKIVAFVLGALVPVSLAWSQGSGCGGACGGGCDGAGGGAWRTQARRTVVEQPARVDRIAALQAVLVGEYRARDLYEAASERFGSRRYANLAAAERRHIDAIKALLVARGVEPIGPAAVEVAPATIADTEAKALQVEQAAIVAFAALLDGTPAGPERATLERLQAANLRHREAANQDEAAAGRRHNAGRGQRRRGGNGGGVKVDCEVACGSGSSRRC